ncbi:MAG: agmatinase family protein [Crocinitomicaceae bacterium]|nr:agmatinase family protein [Crocinitomicaceae bacterium]
MTKEEKISGFDPNAAGLKDATIFGLPFTPDEADIVLLPVPWEVTVSYGSGTSEGPAHILEASFQIDLHHEEFPDLWKAGIAMADLPEDMLMRSTALRTMALNIIDSWEDGVDVSNDPVARKSQEEINSECEKMNQWVQQAVAGLLDQGKLVGLVGGDHSTPLGYFRELANRYPSFGILHIDAHMDLRIAYEGFQYSHASVMYNALQLPQLTHLVQVGLRDYCAAEAEMAEREYARVKVFSNTSLKRGRFEGENWRALCERIADSLPEFVHISFDIDGLDPTLCPNTGTPVPGGLSFEEATYLLSMLNMKRKKIIGFDLVEVAPGLNEWNGNVGARMLFHLCGVLARSNGKIG